MAKSVNKLTTALDEPLREEVPKVDHRGEGRGIHVNWEAGKPKPEIEFEGFWNMSLLRGAIKNMQKVYRSRRHKKNWLSSAGVETPDERTLKEAGDV